MGIRMQVRFPTGAEGGPEGGAPGGASRLPEELRPLLATLEGSPDAVFITDRQNRIVAWNLSSTRVLGFTPEEALGAPCAELLGGCDGWGNRYCSESCPLVAMAGRGEVVRHFDLKLNAKGRQEVFAEVVILQLSAPEPHQFFLLHILKPSSRALPPAPAAVEEPSAPARAGGLDPRESPDARIRKLTQREVEVLGLLAAGRTTPEIANILHISTLTVRNHIQSLLDKLEVHSKAEVVAFAFQKGLV